MIPWYWSWLLAGLTFVGLWLAGSQRSVGWLIQLAANVVWIAYALTTRQYGFLVGAAVTSIALARNYANWVRR